MNLLVTEITDMGANRRCIGGWDATAQRMVRPLPDGNNWEASWVEQLKITVGGRLTCFPTGHLHPGEFPHSTEDTEVVRNTLTAAAPVSHFEWTGTGSPATAASVGEAFAEAVEHNSVWNGRRQGVFVPRGTSCHSLVGLRLPAGSVEFVEEFDKLKAYVDDGHSVYSLSVSGHHLRSIYATGGPQAANESLPNQGYFHVRLGLARAFGDYPNNCYVMLNGINW